MEGWQAIRDVLFAPITQIDGKTLTPTGILQIAIIVLIAWLIARWIGWLVRTVLTKRLRLQPGYAQAFGQATRYTLLFAGIYAALASVGLKMHVLLVLFGGLSVGIGFGMQNLANNLASGALILAEREIRPGREMEVAGLRGIVEEVRMRSIRLRADDGRLVILPTSILLVGPVVLHQVSEE